MTKFFEFFILVMIDFQAIIIKWYKNNKRQLPWRETKDPYRIWVSEIILQQTRVKQGQNYYINFINIFPDIQTLANSSLDALLKVWQGLGYYSRARNMHIAAKFIIENLNGKFPDNYEDLLKLKGIGEYTAAAIASISFNKSHAVLDGNVYRVLARIFGVKNNINTSTGKNEFKKLANELISKKNPAEYNQAIMEFGAVQCIPKNPLCINCPLLNSCYAHNNNLITQLPVKINRINIKKRYFYYLVIKQGDFIYLNKRTGKDIWNSLYEFPLIEMNNKVTDEEIIQSKKFNKLFEKSELIIHKKSKYFKHILTHQVIHAKYYLINLRLSSNNILKEYIKIPMNKLNDYPVPKLISLIIEDFNI
ncbi:A/G-specific adenine glycosylase [Bacteroidota bacterium]